MTKPLATMTVEVIPSLPDDFAETISRAIDAATGRALILAGIPMVRAAYMPASEIPAEVHEAITVLFRYVDAMTQGDPR